MRWNAFRVPCETNLLRPVSLASLSNSKFPTVAQEIFVSSASGCFFNVISARRSYLGLLFLFLSIPMYNSEDDEHLLMNDATVHVNM